MPGENAAVTFLQHEVIVRIVENVFGGSAEEIFRDWIGVLSSDEAWIGHLKGLRRLIWGDDAREDGVVGISETDKADKNPDNYSLGERLAHL